MEPRPSALMVTTRLAGDLAARTESAAARWFQGNEAMLTREALIVYLRLRDALGYDFDREIDRLTGECELAVS